MTDTPDLVHWWADWHAGHQRALDDIREGRHPDPAVPMDGAMGFIDGYNHAWHTERP